MSDTIELAAKAIAESLEASGALPQNGFTAGDPWVMGPCLLAARAVLQEIATASFDMAQAGAAAIEHDVTWHQSPPNVCGKAFRAMIEEALK